MRNELKQLNVRALGEPIIEMNGEPMTHWRMAKSVELFFFLLHYNRPVRKEKLLVTLWPDEDNDLHSDQNLRAAIYHLRKVLGKSIVVYRDNQYVLNTGSLYREPISYDVSRFLDLYQQEILARKDFDEQARYQILQEMVALYQGDYVQSFYGDWCISRREELRRTYIEARRQLAAITWKNKHINETIKHWQHILVIENCFEEAHYEIMRCFIRMNKRELALRQYQRCKENLQRELATTPNSHIQKLYQHLVNPGFVS